ncbi:MAG TPA: AI-2E family transporter [Thermoanaerobaculia bacterium]|nr:AI-2E family transporter [Thermoanaerobaculia bacterium]
MFAKKAAIVFGFAVGLLLLWWVRRIVVIILIAAILAAGIAPIVKRVQVLVRRYMHRRISRGAAVLVVYFPFLIIAVLVVALVLPRLMVESKELMVQLPPLIEEKIVKPLGKYLPIDQMRQLVESNADLALADLPIFGYVKSVVHLVAATVAVLFLIVYMLIDAARLRNLFLLFYPAEVRFQKRRMMIRMARRMSYWLSGQILLATIVGTATFIGLVLLGVPYAAPLAFLAAFGEMIPIIGPVLGAVPAVIVALFQSTWQFWSVLALAILIQQVENYFLVPRILGKRISVSPLAVFIAFMIGGSLLGIVGAVLAIPVSAIVQVAFEEAFIRPRERRRDFERAGTLLKE